MWVKIFVALGIAVICVALWLGFTWRQEWVFEGAAQGTWYRIVVRSPLGVSHQKVQLGISESFDRIDRRLSTYRSDSEISRFNRLRTTEVVSVSPDFFFVLSLSKRIYQETEGAFDPTVAPLITAWAPFFRQDFSRKPTAQTLSSALAHVGLDKIHIVSSGRVQKRDVYVQLNFNAIAQGYTVDVVARSLRALGVTDYFVEIGGEVAAAGTNAAGKAWKVGVNTPLPGADSEAVSAVLPIDHQAVSTSGSYRDYVVYKGKSYSHILNPKTGWPVEHEGVSVSVIAPNCSLSDGLDTPLVVLGPKRGAAVLKKFPGTRALFMLRRQDGTLRSYWTL